MDPKDLNMLELELRQVPGIVGIGVEEIGPALLLHLLTGGVSPHALILRSAAEIVSNHAESLTVLSLLTPMAPPVPVRPPRKEGVRLLSSTRLQDGTGDDGVKVTVELAYDERVGIGHYRGAGPGAAATATLGALSDLRLTVPFALKAALRVLGWLDGQVVVIVALTPPTGADRLGVAQASTVDEAAALAVLQALGRVEELEEPELLIGAKEFDGAEALGGAEDLNGVARVAPSPEP